MRKDFLKNAAVVIKRALQVLLRVKARYYIAGGIILLSIAVTPWAVADAYEFRGYRAIGGEVFIIPFGIMVAYVICSSLNSYDKGRRKSVESIQDYN